MPSKNAGNNGDNSEDNFEDFEIVNSDEISFVKRGRKSEIDPKYVSLVKALEKGQTIKLRFLQISVDRNDPKFNNEKARITSQIRSICRAAGLNKSEFEIKWDPSGFPQVVR